MVRVSRYTHPISLIILDLDSFKEHNDKWGHPAGDVRRREIAGPLRAQVREADMAAPYGEEFAIILPNTPKSGAIRLAELTAKHLGKNRVYAANASDKIQNL